MHIRLRSTPIRKDGYGAKAGEVIRGNLARGRDGKFTAAGAASAKAPKNGAAGRAATREAERKQRQAQRDAERKQRQAEREAERKQRQAQHDAERQARLAQREAERKAKAEQAAKNKKGGGGGKGKDSGAKAAAQAEKEAQRQAEQQRQARQARRQARQRQAAQQQAQAQRQAEAQQRRADAQQRQQATAADRAARQQAQAQRDTERRARQAAMDARRAKLDAAREKMQAQLAARRDAAEARARAKFTAWQTDQAKKQQHATTTTTKPAAKTSPTPQAPSPKASPKAAPKAPSIPSTPTTGAEPAPAPAPAMRATPTAPSAPGPRDRAVRRMASAPLAKRSASTRAFTHSFAISKVDGEQRIVEGIASSEEPDRQPGLWKGAYFAGDIISADAIAAALPDYLEYGNIREMHQPSAVGVVLTAEMRDRQLFLVIKVVDDAAWAKVVEGVYKGFSIGGTCDDAEIIKLGDIPYRRITQLTLTEISLVDRPANPAARFTLWKGVHMDPNKDAELQKAAGGDPTKAIAALQQLRDAAELAGDLTAAQNYSLAIAAALEGAGIAQPADEATEPDGDEGTEPDGDEGDLAMAEGLDDLPDDDAMVAMASRITDIAKVGRSVSTANLGHLTAIHDAIMKIAGDTLCKAGQPAAQPAADPAAPVTQAEPAGDLRKIEDLQATIEALQKRLEQVEAQPVPGGPVLRATEKQLPGEPAATPAVRKSAYSDADLRRLALSEPNAQLRAQYAAELAARSATS